MILEKKSIPPAAQPSPAYKELIQRKLKTHEESDIYIYIVHR